MLRAGFIFAFFVFSLILNGQDSRYNGNPDRTFELARDLAFNGKRPEAQDSLILVLTKYPDYHDVREFLGSTYSWDGSYEKARRAFSYILERDPRRKNTWVAMINNELWSGNSITAEELANKALVQFPEDEELLYKKASAQLNGRNPEEAMSTVKSILAKAPSNQKALDFKAHLIDQLSYNSIGVRVGYDIYSQVFDPMQYYTLKYSRKTSIGSIIGKINVNKRFNEYGMQWELDAYPRIAKGIYGFLNIGHSYSFLFPDLRYSGELFTSLGGGLESSIGFRSLKYDNSITTIYTGSLGWYTGNHYLYVRPYFTPNDLGTSKSGSINYRKYRRDAYNYLSLSFSMGFSPAIDRFAMGGLEKSIVHLKSQSFGAGYYFSTNRNRLAWGLSATATHQEISFDQGNYFWIYSLAFLWEIRT